MYILSIDTTNRNASCSLSKAGNIIGYKITTEPSKQAEELLPMVRTLLEENSISFIDISTIAVTSGPGSFTGIRIGLSAVLGMSLPYNTRILSITNLKLLAYKHNISKDKSWKNIITIINAGRGKYYTQIFNNRLEKLEETQLINYSDAVNLIEKFDSAAIIAPKDDFPNHHHLIHENINATDVASWAITADSSDIQNLTPTYIKHVDAVPIKHQQKN